MKSSTKLNLKEISFLAQQIGFPQEKLLKISENINGHTSEFVLRKIKKGKLKERDLVRPSKLLKVVLRKINKNLLNKFHLSQGVCGGVINHSLFDMVEGHCGREAILSLDLERFFPNISYERIFSLFKDANCSTEIAKILTNLVTYKSSLPQGFPTSPTIANIIATNMDIVHLAICKKHNLYRTRWIDDIIISGRTVDIKKAKYKLIKSIEKSGFTVNPDKTVFQLRKNIPEVVGLNLNKAKPYISEKIVNKVDSMIDSLKTNGEKVTRDIFEDEFGKKDIIESLTGKINYIKQFNELDGEKLENKLSQFLVKT